LCHKPSKYATLAAAAAGFPRIGQPGVSGTGLFSMPAKAAAVAGFPRIGQPGVSGARFETGPQGKII